MYISIHINNNNLFTKNSLLQFFGGKGGEGNIFLKKFKFNYFKFCIFMKFVIFYLNFFFGDLMNSKTLQRLKCSDLQNEAFTDNHSRGQFINATW